MITKEDFSKIKIGDEVYFEDPHQSNYDLYWKVIDKTTDGRLLVEIDEMGREARWIVSADQVRQWMRR